MYTLKIRNLTANYIEYTVYESKLGVSKPVVLNLQTAIQNVSHTFFKECFSTIEYPFGLSRKFSGMFITDNDRSRSILVGVRVFFKTPYDCNPRPEIFFFYNESPYSWSFQELNPSENITERSYNTLTSYLEDLEERGEIEETETLDNEKLSSYLFNYERNFYFFRLLDNLLFTQKQDLLAFILNKEEEISQKLKVDAYKLKVHNYLYFLFGDNFKRIKSLKLGKSVIYVTYFLVNSSGFSGIGSTIVSMKNLHLFPEPIEIQAGISNLFHTDALPVKLINFYHDDNYVYFTHNSSWMKVEKDRKKELVNTRRLDYSLEISKEYLTFEYYHSSLYECFLGKSVPKEAITTNMYKYNL